MSKNGEDFIVPITVKRIAFDSYLGQLIVAYLAGFLILPLIQPYVNLKALLGCRGPNQFHHNFQSLKWDASPVPSDVTEQPVLNLIPFTCPWWVMAKLDLQAGLVSQLL